MKHARCSCQMNDSLGARVGGVGAGLVCSCGLISCTECFHAFGWRRETGDGRWEMGRDRSSNGPRRWIRPDSCLTSLVLSIAAAPPRR
ncbi:hypothetical protein BDZ91DRAFT_723722 [Kalaharituber pfeilii]|nr:hypothetical protein BDZ91DRAFT_723722 [Kalaharituber pfeilii]